MKGYIMVIAAGVMLASCGGSKKTQTEDTASQTPAETLIAQLDSASQNGRLYFGHHDDTAYGHTWKYEEGRSDVKDVTGEYPGLMSWDLGHIELDSARNLDGVPFAFIAEQIAAQNARGGINTISWHLRNPLSGGDAWDVSVSPLQELDNDSVLAAKLDSWIGKTADFMLSLKDAEGNRIPVIFRPWHENIGKWFWWGAGNGTPEQYKELWKRTRRIYDEKGVDNVVWAYSPGDVAGAEEYLLTYPGDDLIDILGTDIYHFGGIDGTEHFRATMAKNIDILTSEAQKRGKIAAMTETGLESVVIDDWYTQVLLPLFEGQPIAYVCVWRNANQDEKPEHYYAPFPGHPAADDFKAFKENPKTIFVK